MEIVGEIQEQIRKLKRKLERVRRESGNIGDISIHVHTIHGGWSKGYCEGKIAVLEDTIDFLNELIGEFNGTK